MMKKMLENYCHKMQPPPETLENKNELDEIKVYIKTGSLIFTLSELELFQCNNVG
jgi:hypothetical protein